MTRRDEPQTPLEPRDDELSALLRHEPFRQGPSPKARAWLDAHVGASLGVTLAAPPAVPGPAAPPVPAPPIPALPVPAPVAVGLGLGKAAWPLVALTVAAGATLGSLAIHAGRGAPTTVSAPRASHAPMATTPAVLPAPESIVAPVVRPSRALNPEAPARTAPSAGKRAKSLAQERVLVDRIRDALADGEPHQALKLLDQARSRFSNGVLAEEREVLQVVALRETGARDQARASAATFRANHPRSLFLPALDEALADELAPR